MSSNTSTTNSNTLLLTTATTLFFLSLTLYITHLRQRGRQSKPNNNNNLPYQVAQRILQLKATNNKLFIGICGIPGSGKSTLSEGIVRELDKVGCKSLVVPMDGYHYYKAELDRMPDPQFAHARRGAPFTFNANQFAIDLNTSKNNPTRSFSFPEFQHGVGDPKPNAIHLTNDVQVVLVEGNYLLLQEPAWIQARKALEYTFYLDIDQPTAKERLAQRHSKAWNWPIERARNRVEASDKLNMDIIEPTKMYADQVIVNS
jgi:pantothenate kinase